MQGTVSPAQAAFLANANTGELHDLAHITSRCQVTRIKPAHRVYFASREQAIQLGYDYCAYCFGKELSQR